VTLSYKIKKKN